MSRAFTGAAAVAVAVAIAVSGAGAPSSAGAGAVTWSSRDDFERNLPGAGGATSRSNIETAALPGSVTLAGTREGPGERAGPDLQIAKDVKVTMWPTVAAAPKVNEYLALWADARGAGQSTILAQRLDARGKPLGKAVALGKGSTPQISPAAAFDESSGHYLVVWIEYRNMTIAVYARRITAAGALAGPDVLLSEGENNAGPHVVWNPAAKEFLVVWTNGAYDILARRVSQRGTPVGPAVRVCADPGAQSQARVAYRAASGDYLICWTDKRKGNDDVYCRPAQADGSLPTQELPVRAEAFGEILADLVVNGRDDEILVLWEDYRDVAAPKQRPTMGDFLTQIIRTPGNEVNLFGQRLDGAGSLVGAEIPVCAAEANQLKPRGAFIAISRQYVLVWQDGRSGYGNWDIVGRLVGADGSLGPEFEVANQPREQLGPQIACHPGSTECLVTWLSLGGTGAKGDAVGAQRIAGKPGGIGVLGGIRVNAGAAVRWGALAWSADLPPGAGMAFRTRSAGSEEGLAAAPWSGELRVSGAAVESPPGAWLEIEVRLESTDGKSAPVLHDFSVHFEG